MAGLVVLGAVIGVLLAYIATRNKNNFRKTLLDSFELYSKNSAASDYVSGILKNRARWMRSMSAIRKPFSKEINLTVETAALVLTLMALVNSIVNYDKLFPSAAQGFAVIIFLGMVLTYVPAEWVFSGRIEKRMDAVLDELKDAMEKGVLESYIAEAKKNWQ